MGKSKKSSLGRRAFLKNSTAGAAAILSIPIATTAAENIAGLGSPAQPRNAEAPLPPRTAPVAPAEPEVTGAEVLTIDHPGSDFMLDVIKSIGFEYMCSNPGDSFRSFHESLINYGGNRNPEFITCTHEELAAGMAHGYAKIEGKPLMVCVHGTVGAQHAAMAVYDAYCDRVPMLVILGNFADADWRRNWVIWAHSAQDPAQLIREFTKWDDQPRTLEAFAESAMRAYKVSMTPPMMPVALVIDAELQEAPIPADPGLHIPKLTLADPPQGDSNSVAEAARLLAAAENPVIVADRAARTPAGLASLIELTETLQAAVIDRNGRMNFPTRHPLNQTEARRTIADADLILGLELADFFGVVNSFYGQANVRSRPRTKLGTKLISINSNDLYLKSNYQDFQRFQPVDLAMAADAEATLPVLIEAVKHEVTSDRRIKYQRRGATLAAAHRDALSLSRELAANGWDASPISTGRLCAELWAQIKDEDWSLVSSCTHVSRWPLRLWTFDKHYQYIGGPGGYGVGYVAPASVGAALANRKHGRLTVSIQDDGDLMFGPGVLWTAAHHRIPLLMVLHNNRAYHQEVMQVQLMANQHERGITRTSIGTTLHDPAIDFSKVAQGLGVYAEGPIGDPKDLAGAFRRAIDVVKRGEPALVDVLTQPR